jgi:hypothetical protein
VDVRCIAQQEAAPGAKARRAAVMDTVRREPTACPERKARPGLAAHVRHDGVEGEIVPAAQLRRQDPDDAPMVLAVHGKEQVEAFLPQVDVELVLHHVADGDRVGDEEHVLVRRAGKRDAADLAHRAARPVAAREPGRRDRARRAVGLPQLRDHAIGVLLERGKLGVPLHADPEFVETIAQDALVVVLAQHEDEGKRALALAHVADGNARRQAALRPQVRALGALAERERAVDHTELGVDLQRARLHADRARLLRGSGVPVDDQHAHAAPRELIGEHEAGGAGAHDRNVGVQCGGAAHGPMLAAARRRGQNLIVPLTRAYSAWPATSAATDVISLRSRPRSRSMRSSS